MSKSLKDTSDLALQRERARKLQEYAGVERELATCRADLDALVGSAFTNTGPYVKAVAAARDASDRWRRLYRRIDGIERELRRRDAELYPSDQPLSGFEGDPRQPLETQSRFVALARGRH